MLEYLHYMVFGGILGVNTYMPLDRPRNKKPLYSLTMKQEKLIDLLLVNIGEVTPKPKWKLLKEAGYTVAIQKNPALIFNSPAIQARLAEVLPVEKMLADRRRMAIAYLTDKKLAKESAKGLASVIDLLTKNHQLLTGGLTEAVGTITGMRIVRDIDVVKPVALPVAEQVATQVAEQVALPVAEQVKDTIGEIVNTEA